MGLTLFLAALVMLAMYIRLAPSPPDRWHITLDPRPAPLGAPSAQVVALEGGAYVDLAGGAKELTRLDQIALASPRTQRLAGDALRGHVTYITRSRLWGFPDYTTVQLGAKGITIYARLRFGRGDMGVNAARLASWQAALNGQNLSQN